MTQQQQVREVAPGAAESRALLAGLGLACERADGVAPFGESALIDAESEAPQGRMWALGEAGAAYVLGEHPAELAVHPEHRRRGAGRALVSILVAAGHDRAWAHGDLPGARALADRLGWHPVRTLLSLVLSPLPPELADPPVPPEGFAIRSLVPGGADETELLAVNAAAFASHPEQGALDLAGLHQLMAQPWFDPAGVLLLEDVSGSAPVLAGFHWTKVEPGTTCGEVYVVGVAPAYQGRGLGKVVTAMGTAHLAGRGVEQITLYVEADNLPALATYERVGFRRSAADVVFAEGSDQGR